MNQRVKRERHIVAVKSPLGRVDEEVGPSARRSIARDAEPTRIATVHAPRREETRVRDPRRRHARRGGMRRRPPIARMAYRERCGKRRASSAECAGIGAGDAHAAARGLIRQADPLARNTKDAVLRRRVRERRIRDHAAGLVRRRTERQTRKTARHAPIVRDDHICAQEHRHDQLFAQCRVRLDLVVQ
jgi:hypothetical protein